VQTIYESQLITSNHAEGLFSSYSEFTELRRLMKASHRLRRTTAFPWSMLAILLAMIAVMSAVMILWHRIVAAQAINGILLALIFTQIGFLMHDAGHGQVFRSPAANRRMGLLCGNLMLGVSYSWWVDKHNRHHKNPNHIDGDPDVDFAALAFCHRQAAAKGQPWRLIIKYQAALFIPFLLAEHLSMHVRSLRHLFQEPVKNRGAERFLLACHHVLFFGMAFSLLGIQAAIAFLVCSKAFAGLYAGLVFAPNHKGMLMVDEESQLGLLRRQVLTSRNIRSGLINDFLYGGLNYQIEHHLFPFLKRSQLAVAQRIVKPFCEERGIRYHETGVFQSLKEIFQHLHKVGISIQTEPSDDLGP
jgi:fatty acid desaturase